MINFLLRAIVYPTLIMVGSIAVLYIGVQIIPIKEKSPPISYNTETTGVLISAKPKTSLIQTPTGGDIKIHHYITTYIYMINGRQYTGTWNIDGKLVNGYALQQILNTKDKKIMVRYNKTNPEKSRIFLEEE